MVSLIKQMSGRLYSVLEKSPMLQRVIPHFDLFRTVEMKNFIRDVGMLFFFNRLGSIFPAVIAILAARQLGPAEYGKIGLINNIGYLLVIPALLGVNNAMYKFIPESTKKQNDELKAAALIGNLGFLLCFTLFYLSVGGWVERYLRIPGRIWQIGVVATVVFDLYSLSESFIRGRKQFFSIAWMRLAGNLLFFLVFALYLYYFRNLNAERYFYAFLASQLLFVVLAFLKSGVCSFSFSGPVFSKIFKYGFWNMVNSLFAMILFSSDLFIVNFFFAGKKEVGIYQVYQGFAKSLFSVVFFDVFAVVFLPTIARMNKSQLYQMFRRFVPLVLPLIILATALLMGIIVWLTGKEYGFNWWYILLVSSGVGFYMVYQIDNAIFTMEGNRGARMCLLPLIIILPVSLGAQYLLTKIFGITGILVAVTVTNLLLVAIFIIIWRMIPAESWQAPSDEA